MRVTQHFLIAGRVQGVSFRAFTLRRARELNLLGWVRNLDDGRVEVLAQGSDEQLANFTEKIRKGPMLAKVENLVSRTVDATEELGEFEITIDGVKPWLKE